jgi:zinc transport system substrate-binding protein
MEITMHKKNNKLRSFFLIIVLMLAMSGCGQGKTDQNHSEPSQQIFVYTTLFPLYDFASQIGGEHVTVESIIPPGAEPHDFEPTAKDMVELNQADLFVYNGAGYEAWIERAIENLDGKQIKIVDASEGLNLLKGEIHHQDEEHGSHDEHEDGDHGTEEGEGTEAHDHEHGQYDPHVWLDPMLAKEQANKILQALIEIDPVHKVEYQANFDQMARDLDQIDAEYKELISKASKKELVVSHQAFGYLAHRYGLEFIPVSGLSPSDEPSQKELMNLVDLVKEHNLKYVAFDSLVESKLAESVRLEAGVEAVTLYTIENVTKEQLKAGLTYQDLMRENLETLRKVLEVQ